MKEVVADASDGKKEIRSGFDLPLGRLPIERAIRHNLPLWRVLNKHTKLWIAARVFDQTLYVKVPTESSPVGFRGTRSHSTEKAGPFKGVLKASKHAKELRISRNSRWLSHGSSMLPTFSSSETLVGNIRRRESHEALHYPRSGHPALTRQFFAVETRVDHHP
jgi:hypothetical protein